MTPLLNTKIVQWNEREEKDSAETIDAECVPGTLAPSQGSFDRVNGPLPETARRHHCSLLLPSPVLPCRISRSNATTARQRSLSRKVNSSSTLSGVSAPPSGVSLAATHARRSATARRAKCTTPCARSAERRARCLFGPGPSRRAADPSSATRASARSAKRPDRRSHRRTASLFGVGAVFVRVYEPPHEPSFACRSWP